MQQQSHVLAGSSRLPVLGVEFELQVWTRYGRDDIVVLTRGCLDSGDPLVRIHSACMTGDVFGSMRCDCGEQLDAAIKMIAEESAGAILYPLGHEGRAIGLVNKIRAYHQQDVNGLDTFEANRAIGFDADLRDYSASAAILRSLGAKSVRLLTSNPLKVAHLSRAGIAVTEVVPIDIVPTDYNRSYIESKRRWFVESRAASAGANGSETV